ncbi:MAG: nuclear transport factor 2 family protein [Pyrinomonadaceae bacterium]|nr:nuclear transport factor 2 family protein [Blastocatellia bacterium]
MNEQENTKIVQQAYENFKNGDITALLDLYSDDIDWRLPEIENMPWFGSRKGREETAEFIQSLAEAQDVLTFNPREFIAQGDKVVALGDYSWRVKVTGREFGGDWAHVWTVKNGKLAGFQEYADTAAASKAHQKAAGA